MDMDYIVYPEKEKKRNEKKVMFLKDIYLDKGKQK